MTMLNVVNKIFNASNAGSKIIKTDKQFELK